MLKLYVSIIIFMSIFQWMVPFNILKNNNLMNSKQRKYAFAFGLFPIFILIIPILFFKESTLLIMAFVGLVYITHITNDFYLSVRAFRRRLDFNKLNRYELYLSILAPIVALISIITSLSLNGISLDIQLSFKFGDVIWLKQIIIVLISGLSAVLPAIFIRYYVFTIDIIDKAISFILSLVKLSFKLKPIHYKWLVLLGITIGFIFLANYDLSTISLQDDTYMSRYYGTLSVYHVIFASLFIPWVLNDKT